MRKFTSHRRPDFSRSRAEFGREEHRFYGQQKQSGKGEVVSPFGRQPMGIAGRTGRQFGDPLSAYFGVQPDFGPGRRGQRQQARWQDRINAIEQGDSPLAQFARGAGDFLSGMQGQAQDVGQRIASQAPEIYELLKSQIGGALGQLPGLQESASNQAATAQRFLDEASSPIASQALYQNALRGGLEGARAGASARGLLDAGGAQAMEETMGRDLAAQFAQRQAAERQAALGGVQSALGAQAGLLPLGAQLAGMQGQGLDQLSQLLQQGYNLPAEAIQQAFQQFAAFQNPALALLSLTAPQVAQTTKGGGFNIL